MPEDRSRSASTRSTFISPSSLRLGTIVHPSRVVWIPIQYGEPYALVKWCRLAWFGLSGSYIRVVPAAQKPRELDLARIRRWVEQRVPPERQAEVRLEVGVHGANVTVFELRPPWCTEVGPGWSRRALVQFRHTGSGFWLLLWKNRRDRWERYPLAPEATRDLDALLGELEEDGMCLFWS